MPAPISGSMWSFFWYVFPATLAGSLVGILVEILIPGEKQSWTSRLRAIPIWAIYILIGLSISAVLQYCLGLLHIHPLVLIDLRKTTGSKDVLTAIVAYPAWAFSYTISSTIGSTGSCTTLRYCGAFTRYIIPLRN